MRCSRMARLIAASAVGASRSVTSRACRALTLHSRNLLEAKQHPPQGVHSPTQLVIASDDGSAPSAELFQGHGRWCRLQATITIDGVITIALHTAEPATIVSGHH